MMVSMKKRLLTLYLSLVTLLTPVAAFGAKNDSDDETTKFEARMEGYSDTVRLGNGSTSLTWIMIGFLSAITVACFFKNAKRTHLD